MKASMFIPSNRCNRRNRYKLRARKCILPCLFLSMLRFLFRAPIIISIVLFIPITTSKVATRAQVNRPLKSLVMTKAST